MDGNVDLGSRWGLEVGVRVFVGGRWDGGWVGVGTGDV